MSPLPNTRNVATIIRFLKQERPRRPRKQIIAMALEHARKHGARTADPRKDALVRMRHPVGRIR